MLVCYQVKSHSIVFRQAAFPYIHDGMTYAITQPLDLTPYRVVLPPFMAYLMVIYGRCTDDEAIYRRISQQHDYVT
jgi:hypothetical protein